MNKRKGPPQDMVPLSSGILVPRGTHDALFGHLPGRIPKLVYGKPYKTKAMIAPEFYEQHDPWVMGYCVADWERNHKVDLRFLGCPYCSVRYYERT